MLSYASAKQCQCYAIPKSNPCAKQCQCFAMLMLILMLSIANAKQFYAK